MSAREFMGWQGYYQIEPFGADRDNWHSARIAQILANIYRKSGSAPVGMSEFMYVDQKTDRERKEQATLTWLMQRSVESN